MKTKLILTYLMIVLQTMLFSQTSSYANINFGHAPDCVGYSGICAFQSTGTMKSSANTELIFNIEESEISLIFDKKELDEANKSKLLDNEFKKGSYLYNLDTDFNLPDQLKKDLNIKLFKKVKQGNHLVKVEGDFIIMKLELE